MLVPSGLLWIATTLAPSSFRASTEADRLLAVDENGEVVDGDQIMAIIGNHMRDNGKLKKALAPSSFRASTEV